jgi:hypothetical protein
VFGRVCHSVSHPDRRIYAVVHGEQGSSGVVLDSLFSDMYNTYSTEARTIDADRIDLPTRPPTINGLIVGLFLWGSLFGISFCRFVFTFILKADRQFWPLWPSLVWELRFCCH